MITLNGQPGNGIADDEARECLVSMRILHLVMEHPSVDCGSPMPPILFHVHHMHHAAVSPYFTFSLFLPI